MIKGIAKVRSLYFAVIDEIKVPIPILNKANCSKRIGKKTTVILILISEPL